ncbi:MAG: hypothetical protein NXI25_26805 [bacterium]|nr:hypothetical protein [bacterium]
MTSIEVVDVNNETKTDGESPINIEVVEQNETVNEEPTPEEPKEPTPKPKALPRIKKEVELVQCNACGRSMTAKSLRFSHPKNCRGAKTELLPVNPQKNIRKIQPEVKEEIKNEIKQEVIKETIKKPTATELLTQHYEELKQKKKQDKSDKINKLTLSMF